MNLYLYANKSDFAEGQCLALAENFDDVKFSAANNYEDVINDSAEKVIALDPDVVGWKFPNDLIAKIPNLKAICLETTGYEWVDGDFCAKRGIALTNVPHYATNAVAEKCVMMALALAKKLPLFLREGRMNYDSAFIGEEMWDKPTDIIGFGAIGRALAQKLDGLVGRKEICFYSRHQDDPEYHYWPFEDMLEKSEYMFITCAKNTESLALFDDLSRFNRNMKVIVVANGFEEVSRRLVDKCEAGELGGVAFESDDPEILQKQYHSNIFVTPPNAYYTYEALQSMFGIWTKTIIAAQSQPINQVN